MSYADLSESNTGIVFDAETYVVTAEDTGEVIQITFPLIYEIKVYGYGYDVDNVTKFENLSFSNSGSVSTYTATISKEEIFGNDNESGTTIRSGASSSITIYASKKTEPEDWIPLKSVEVELSLKTAPNLSITERTKDSVSLEASSEALSGGMEYKISYGDKTEEFNKFPHEIKGVGAEAFTVTVSHRYAGTEEWGELTQTISVPEFDIREGAIDISIDKATGSIIASKLSDYSGNYAKIGIFAVESDNSLTELYSEPFTGTSDTMTFDNETVFGGFYAGKIRVVLFDESSSESTACLSSWKEYEIDLMLLLLNERIGKQNYSVILPVSPKFNISSIEIPNDKFESALSEGNILIKSKLKTVLSGSPMVGVLESNTDYSIDITIHTASDTKIVKSLPFATESFAGEYIWGPKGSGNVTQFAVYVQDKKNGNSLYGSVPAESKYGYYIFASVNDENNVENKETNIRLMPLVDESIGEPFENGCSYDEAPYPYRWNNLKWNSMASSPLGKVTNVNKIESNETDSKDKFSSIVESKAALSSSPSTTQTDFSFYETESGDSYLVFSNKIIEGMGDSFLNLNKTSPKEYFEEDEHFYTLTLQE